MTKPAAGDSRIVRDIDPPNLEMHFGALDAFVTPTASHYVRCHFPIPEIDVRAWRLQVEGRVERPVAFKYEELLTMPSRTIAATLECAGNSRDFLQPKVKGVPWQLGAVGNAEWTGVPLREVLDRAGLRGEACEVILEGGDEGEIKESLRPAGRIRFARSLPLAKALDDVLLAWEMNGEALSAAHGFPLRAVVPGWYAVASVKWLERIVVTDHPFQGYYQTIDYARWDRRGPQPELVPLTEMEVKAQIAQPETGAEVPARSTVRVHGAAWSSSLIAKVELSGDGGATWDEAQLLGEAVSSAWRLWEYHWQTPETPGPVTLVARATDTRGETQPATRDLDRGTYMINHVLPVLVTIR